MISTFTQADKAIDVDREHIWLQCFRTCSRCCSVSEYLTVYEFSDGSAVILDSRYAFPQPVDSQEKLKIA